VSDSVDHPATVPILVVKDNEHVGDLIATVGELAATSPSESRPCGALRSLAENVDLRFLEPLLKTAPGVAENRRAVC